MSGISELSIICLLHNVGLLSPDTGPGGMCVTLAPGTQAESRPVWTNLWQNLISAHRCHFQTLLELRSAIGVGGRREKMERLKLIWQIEQRASIYYWQKTTKFYWTSQHLLSLHYQLCVSCGNGEPLRMCVMCGWLHKLNLSFNSVDVKISSWIFTLVALFKRGSSFFLNFCLFVPMCPRVGCRQGCKSRINIRPRKYSTWCQVNYRLKLYPSPHLLLSLPDPDIGRNKPPGPETSDVLDTGGDI